VPGATARLATAGGLAASCVSTSGIGWTTRRTSLAKNSVPESRLIAETSELSTQEFGAGKLVVQVGNADKSK
jgi:hypothetical protein